MKKFMRGWKGPGTLVLVTHQVNVTALTDVFPASGEMVVLRPDGQQIGRIPPVLNEIILYQRLGN